MGRGKGLGVSREDRVGPLPTLWAEEGARSETDRVLGTQAGVPRGRQGTGLEEDEGLRAGRACGLSAAEFDLIVRPGPRLAEGAMIIARCLRR